MVYRSGRALCYPPRHRALKNPALDSGFHAAPAPLSVRITSAFGHGAPTEQLAASRGRRGIRARPGPPARPRHESGRGARGILPHLFLRTFHPFRFDVRRVFERKESDVTRYPGMPRKTIVRATERNEQTADAAGLFSELLPHPRADQRTCCQEISGVPTERVPEPPDPSQGRSGSCFSLRSLGPVAGCILSPRNSPEA